MSTKVADLYEKTKSFSKKELGEFLRLLLDDPRISEDLLDLALIKQAKAEGDESVTIDELLAGKRTYR